MAGVKVNVHVSRKNRDKLSALSIQTRMPKGRIVDDALSLLFTPPEERSDRVLLRRLDILEDVLERTNRNVKFNGDMTAEYVWRWLKEQPTINLPRSLTDEHRNLERFKDFMSKVVERANTEVS